MKYYPLRATYCALLCLFTLLFTTGCQADLANPPRLATATAQARQTVEPTATPEPLILPAPTPTGESMRPVSGAEPVSTGPYPRLTIWINESAPIYNEVMEEMVATFSANHDIDVEWRLVSPMLLPQLVETAVSTTTLDLPDLILHPIEFTVGWAERGILDPAAAEQIIDAIGRDTFNPNALELAQVNGRITGIPSDGFQQLIIYRQDWFEREGLAPPSTYEALLTAAETTSDPENLINSFVIPTESNLRTTHQAFEHLALGNGCELIHNDGRVGLLDQSCRDAINFYFTIVHNYSPSGVQTDTSTRNAYLEGRTGLIMGPPSLLPMLAGLDPANPPRCPECNTADFLAQNSGILTAVSGNGPEARPANFSQVNYLGITGGANLELAQTFVRFWFNEGYEQWLAVESERRVPMRWGTAEEPRRFIDQWGRQPLSGSNLSLEDIYGEETVSLLRDNVARANRWGLPQAQGGLATQLYEELTISIVLQEMLSGYFNTEDTLQEAYRRVTALIPGYDTPPPTPETENDE
jgi:multiple sugar transport system substrate-binding protein